MNEDLTKAFRLFRQWEKKKAKVGVMIMSDSQQMIVNLTGRIIVRDSGFNVTGNQLEFRFAPQPNMDVSLGDNTVGIVALGYRVALFLSRE